MAVVNSFREGVNFYFAGMEPVDVCALTLLIVICGVYASKVFNYLKIKIEDKGIYGFVSSVCFGLVRLLPGVGTLLETEKRKVISKLQGPIHKQKLTYRRELPQWGLGSAVSAEIQKMHAADRNWRGRCSGTVYMGGPAYSTHLNTVTFAYNMFSHSNPLHSDIFPSVAKFEYEVVSMTASMLGSQSEASGGQVCGNMTSGGSESILMAVKTTRDFMRAKKNVTAPEMVIAGSAHSAYDKAAQYFNIRLRRVPVGPDYKADVKSMARAVNKNTIMVVGSAPSFPHGVIDPIQELGAMAIRKGICLHVDLCLGGFVLPFAQKLGYPIPPFGFEVPGVTSVSVDTHKYGLGPKGSSVVLYRNHEIRQHQFVAVTEWSGGLYISPTVSGSRPGGLIAAAWASLVSMGESGFTEMARSLMQATQKIIQGVEAIEELHILGKPEMTIVAFGSTTLDIYKVNDVMAEKGWSLNALQKPASLHICVTLQHVNMADTFIQDLQSSVKRVRDSPDSAPDGMAPVYGAAGKIADRGLVEELLVAYMDSTC